MAASRFSPRARPEIGPYPQQYIARPVMYQRWEFLTFLHWAYEPRVIERLLPPQVQLDTYDGAAWIGLAPFLLTRLRPPLLPALPWLSRFPETNVRTYVRGADGKPGVWFFTLEADRLAAVLGARLVYRLPYRWASMRVDHNEQTVYYWSERHPIFGSGRSNITIRPGERINSGNFDNFLTARFRLYTVSSGRLLQADIEHEPWPLQSAELVEMDQDLIPNSGVPQASGTPVVHFSRRLDVRIGWIRSASKRSGSELSS